MENKNLQRLAQLGLQCIADSHDINRNLSLIEADARKNKNEAVLKYVADIRLSMDYLSRIKHQKESVNIVTDISLLELSNKVAKYFNGCYGLKVNVECKKDAIIKTSKIALLQSLINLVDNGLGFSKEDINNQKTCLITVNENTITVSDNGTGVSNELKEKIFELYFTTKDVSKQSCTTGGVGLWAVKQHIDNIGAKISVENNTILPGANFKIILKK